MIKMFTQLWAMMTAFFSAGEKVAIAADRGANSLVHMADWADESAEQFVIEARIERRKKQMAYDEQTLQILEEILKEDVEVIEAKPSTPALAA